MGFDNQLGAVERTLQAKVKDYEELLLLSGDANHAREVKKHQNLETSLGRPTYLVPKAHSTNSRTMITTIAAMPVLFAPLAMCATRCVSGTESIS